MIWESSYWKYNLSEEAVALRRRLPQRRWGERSLARLERTVMLGFYSIRKLMEGAKLCDSTRCRSVRLRAYACKGKPVTRFNRHRFHELYDLAGERRISRRLPFLCNQVIYSYVFAPPFNEDLTLWGVAVTSDRNRHKELYGIALPQIIELFELVANDDPNVVLWRFNAKKGDYDVSAWAPYPNGMGP